jgi:glycosyltransferase involved in cell wall biosynthesis
MQWPKVSVVIPTLNAASVLEDSLKSIVSQDYPKDQLEIIIADGGSTDATVSLAVKYGARIVSNKLKTAESGKAAGVCAATGEYIALIDSDNILPTKIWLQKMIGPLLEHSDVVGSEPWAYAWRKEDGFITRYSALIGMNDPFVHFLGNYDRQNLLTGKWTEVPHDEKDVGDYLLLRFDKRGLPTIGANGTVFRTSFLKENLRGDYLFDIDILYKSIAENGSVAFIKVKNSIVHTFCEGNMLKFASKQRRRVKDFLYHKDVAGDRGYDWDSFDFFGSSNRGMFRFIFSCVFVVPLVAQSIKGYIIKPDVAWFFHPLACEITLWEYGVGRILGLFKKSEASRDNWKQ